MFDLLAKGSLRVETAVEIGSEWGWWAHRFLTQVPDAVLYCVDLWAGINDFREWAVNLNRWIVAGRVHAIRADSRFAHKKFDLPIDLLFIDGDHAVASLLKDLTGWVPHVRPGGLVVGHDWGGRRHGANVKRAVQLYWEDPKEYGVDKLYWSGHVLGECFWKRM
jgi:predicted O-methyltransferase YrrM